MRLGDWMRAAAFGVVLAPTFAWADDSLTITLKSGAQYRGELVEKVPNDHITIKLATGEVKTFEWAQIVTQQPDKSSEETTEEAAPPPKPKPRAKPRPTGTLVHIDTSDEHVVLQRYAGEVDVEMQPSGQTAEADAYGNAFCEAPCDTEVPAGSYRLKAPGKTGTDVVTISGKHMTLQANMHASWHKTAAWSFLGFGLISGIVGALFISIAAMPPVTGMPPEDKSGDVVAAAIALGLGGTLLGLSIYCFATTTSSVTVVDTNGAETSTRSRGFVGGIVVPF